VGRFFPEPNRDPVFHLFFAIIGFGIGFVLDYYKTLEAAQRQQSFIPYHVLVQPNWPKLLLDYKLIKDAEAFQQLSEKSLKRAPIRFTVLLPAPKVDLPGLIYWNSRNGFVTEVDFEESIEGIEFEIPGLERFGDKWSPSVYFKLGVLSGGVGYEMGLAMREKWWEGICVRGDAGELCKTKADTDPQTGTTRLVVATLPDSEFDEYYDVEFDKERRHERYELRDKQLSLNGWKCEQSSFFGRNLEHKYFTITHRNV
jgi:hypothetical protein